MGDTYWRADDSVKKYELLQFIPPILPFAHHKAFLTNSDNWPEAK